MKKHSFTMVFLLILTLSLVGVVSASDNITSCDDAPVLESQGENQMEITMEYESYGLTEDISVSNDDSDLIQSETVSQDCLSVCSKETQTQRIDSNYKLGYDITTDFCNSFDCDDYNNVLVITNAGYCKINNQTTENVLNGIIDASNGYITYEDGNLMTLSSNADSMHIAFFVKNDESLTIAFYQESKTPLYYGNASPETSVSQLVNFGLDDETIESYSTVINSWTNSLLIDSNLLTYQGCVPFGLSSGKYMIHNLNYYPHEFDLPLVDILGVSRDFDDDAFILKKSNSSDEKASFAVSMVGKSMEESSSLNLYEIGINATNKALNYLKSQGIDFPKDYPYLYVLTSAGHVKFNGLETDKVIDGLLDALGPKFNKKHLISVDDPSWKDLVFYFIVVKNTKHISYGLKYDSKDYKLVESSLIKEQGDNIAKARGLYSNHYKTHSSHNGIFKRIVVNQSTVDLNQTNSFNVTVGTNSSGNVSNFTTNVSNNSEVPVELPVKSNNNPFIVSYETFLNNKL